MKLLPKAGRIEFEGETFGQHPAAGWPTFSSGLPRDMDVKARYPYFF